MGEEERKRRRKSRRRAFIWRGSHTSGSNQQGRKWSEGRERSPSRAEGHYPPGVTEGGGRVETWGGSHPLSDPAPGPAPPSLDGKDESLIWEMEER